MIPHLKTIQLVMTVAALLCLCTCGSISDPDNQGPCPSPTIAGQLMKPGGKKPAVNIAVTVRPFHSHIEITGTLEKKSGYSAKTVTDNEGRFAFYSIDSGTYVIESIDESGNAIRIEKVVVNDIQQTVIVPVDTLKATGAIRGSVLLETGGDPGTVFIFTLGSDRFTQVKKDSTFILGGLAEGVYDLNCVCILQEYGTFDTASITVTSGDTVDLHSLLFKTTDIHIPQNVTVKYDTLRQYAGLEWNSYPGTGIGGFNVYRYDIDSSMIYSILPLNDTQPLYDHMYTDTTIEQGHTYIYGVTAVTSDGIVGKKCPPLTLTAVSAFNVIDTLTPPEDITVWHPLGIETNTRGETVAAYGITDSTLVVWYSPAGTIDRTIKLPVSIAEKTVGSWDFSLDEKNSCFFFNPDDTTIIGFDSSGRNMFSFPVSGYVRTFDVDNDTLFVVDANSHSATATYVMRYLFSGEQYGFVDERDNIIAFFCDPYGAMITNFVNPIDPVYGSDNRPVGTYVKITTPDSKVQKKIDFAARYWKAFGAYNGELLIRSASGEFRVLSYNGELIARHFYKGESILGAAFCPQRRIAIMTAEGFFILGTSTGGL